MRTGGREDEKEVGDEGLVEAGMRGVRAREGGLFCQLDEGRCGPERLPVETANPRTPARNAQSHGSRRRRSGRRSRHIGKSSRNAECSLVRSVSTAPFQKAAWVQACNMLASRSPTVEHRAAVTDSDPRTCRDSTAQAKFVTQCRKTERNGWARFGQKRLKATRAARERRSGGRRTVKCEEESEGKVHDRAQSWETCRE